MRDRRRDVRVVLLAGAPGVRDDLVDEKLGSLLVSVAA